MVNYGEMNVYRLGKIKKWLVGETLMVVRGFSRPIEGTIGSFVGVKQTVDAIVVEIWNGYHDDHFPIIGWRNVYTGEITLEKINLGTYECYNETVSQQQLKWIKKL